MMRIRSKKGTTMVEAAMIFPLVIACLAAVLYIVIGMYHSLSLQSSLHLALRKECGEQSQTVYRIDTLKTYPLEKDRVGIRPVVRTEQEREYRINVLFKGKVVRTEQGRSYLIDEAELIRIVSFEEDESK